MSLKALISIVPSSFFLLIFSGRDTVIHPQVLTNSILALYAPLGRSRDTKKPHPIQFMLKPKKEYRKLPQLF